MTNYWARRALILLPWLAIALLTAFLTILWLLPAAWVVPQFGRATGGRINLVDPVGSLWHGSASLVLSAGADAGGATVLPGRIEWQTGFWPLFTGRVSMRMRDPEVMPVAVVLDATLKTSTLSPGSIRVPANLLAGLGAPLNTLDPQGEMRLEWTEWRVFGQRGFGQLNITLSDIASRISTVRPLGSYQVAINGVGERDTLKLSTSQGPLLLSGDGVMTSGSFSFQGTAQSTPESLERLRGLLNLLGRRTDDNLYQLNIQRSNGVPQADN